MTCEREKEFSERPGRGHVPADAAEKRLLAQHVALSARQVYVLVHD